MTAAVAVLKEHSNLLRISIASPGNNFSLGAMEAPPAIMSTYFSEDLNAYLEAFRNGKDAAYVPGKNPPSIGVKDITEIKVTATACPERAQTQTLPPAS